MTGEPRWSGLGPARVGWALWGAAFLLYAWGAAPGVEWLDAGELVAAGWSMGIAHPPGEPGYALLARAAAYLPIGEVAFRVNLLSAAAAAWVVMGVFHLCLALVGRGDGGAAADGPALVGAAVGAMVVGLSPILVEQATRAEVYAPAAALVVWGARFGVRFVRGLSPPRIRDALIAAFLLSLAVSVQPLVAASVALPVAVAVAWCARRRLVRLAPWALAMALLGLLALAYLPIRARAPDRPLLVWGEPGTWEAFRAVVSGAAYGQNFAGAGFGGRFVGHLELLSEGTGFAALLAGTTGLLFGAFTRLRGAAVLLAAMFAVVAGTAAQRIFYPANPDVHGYLIAALAFAATGVTVITVGAARLLAGPSVRSTRLAWLLALVPVLGLAAAGPRIHVRDGGFRRADDALLYWDATVGRMPAGPGVYFANSDHALFPAWYERLVAGARPDIAIANDGLVTSSWFLRMIDRSLPPIFVPHVDDGGRRDRLAHRLAADNLTAGRPVGGEWPLTGFAPAPGGAPPPTGITAAPNGLGFRFAPAGTPPEARPAPLPAYQGDIGRRVAGHIALLRSAWQLDQQGGGVWRELPRVTPVFIYEPWQGELVAEDAAFAAGGKLMNGGLPRDAPRERQLLRYWHFRLGEERDSGGWTRPRPEEEIVTAQMLARHQRVPQAKELLRSLLTAAPDNQTATLLLAALLANDGERVEAHALLARLLEDHPDNARAHAQLGLIFAQEGRFADAIAEWRTSLALDPGQPDVSAWLRRAETQRP